MEITHVECKRSHATSAHPKTKWAPIARPTGALINKEITLADRAVNIRIPSDPVQILARGVTVTADLRAPFPWFGGKSRAAPTIWRAFGNVPNYVEPFFGSGAVLLARPHTPKVETINDKDGAIANFWRSVKHAPDEVSKWADWPVNEADLHARHRWLVANLPALYKKLVADPEYYDAKMAGWWVWGICTWIGNGWCHQDVRVSQQRRRPELNAAHGRGVHVLHKTMPKVGTPGNGIHAPSVKKPLTHRNKGIHRDGATVDLFEQLSARLRDVRVCCGDWERIVGRSTLGIDTAHGMTPCGVLLDPPYKHEMRDKRLYRDDDYGLSDRVRVWAIENGDNPALRIALCGFEGEHEMPSSWEKVAWASTSSAKSRAQERIWFSPHCLPAERQGDLFVSVFAEARQQLIDQGIVVDAKQWLEDLE